MPQKSVFDVVVVGSGPAGATTARAAANGGLRVLLVDKKQELGVPIQCSGAVSAHALAQAGIVPDPEFAPAPVFGFATYDAAGNMTTLDYRTLKPELHHNNAPLGYVVDRRRFDRHLLKLAEQAGAQAWLKTAALGYTPHSNGAVSVQLNRMGRPVEVRARVIVGADGVQSQVGKWAGLPTRIKLSDIASCFQLVVDRVETNGLLEIVTGHRWAPGGYAWIFPKGHGYAEVGLGIIRTMTGQDARHHLDDFCRNSFMAPRLRRRRIVEVQGGAFPWPRPSNGPSPTM
ncbi:MAG: geranylgeranyl reductase family protein [Anaerolineae bacterium]